MRISDFLHPLGRLLEPSPFVLIGAATGAVGGWLFPNEFVGQAVVWGFALLPVDALTGVLRSVLKGEAVSSAKLARTLAKATAYAAVFFVLSVATRFVREFAGMRETVLGGAATAMILVEGYSILENCAAIGLPVPKRFMEMMRGADHHPGPSATPPEEGNVHEGSGREVER